MTNPADRICTENKKTFKVKFFFLNLAFYEIMSKNIAQTDSPQMAIWHMRIACWITKAQVHTQKM
jgi:hypothetical protein